MMYQDNVTVRSLVIDVHAQLYFKHDCAETCGGFVQRLGIITYGMVGTGIVGIGRYRNGWYWYHRLWCHWLWYGCCW